MYWLCVLYHCHRVLTQLQLTNISISISNISLPPSVPSWPVIGWPLPLPFLLVCICGCIKSAVRYKCLISVTCHPDTPYLREQGCENPWWFFEAKKSPRARNFAARCPKAWPSARRSLQNLRSLHHFSCRTAIPNFTRIRQPVVSMALYQIHADWLVFLLLFLLRKERLKSFAFSSVVRTLLSHLTVYVGIECSVRCDAGTNLCGVMWPRSEAVKHVRMWNNIIPTRTDYDKISYLGLC